MGLGERGGYGRRLCHELADGGLLFVELVLKVAVQLLVFGELLIFH